LEQGNKYSGSIKLEEFLDELRICWLLNMAESLAVICLNVSIPIFFIKPNIDQSEVYFWWYFRFFMHNIK